MRTLFKVYYRPRNTINAMALTFTSDKLHDILYRRGQTTGSVNVCFILRYKCKKELECLVYLKCLICNTRRSLNLKIADVKV